MSVVLLLFSSYYDFGVQCVPPGVNTLIGLWFVVILSVVSLFVFYLYSRSEDQRTVGSIQHVTLKKTPGDILFGTVCELRGFIIIVVPFCFFSVYVVLLCAFLCLSISLSSLYLLSLLFSLSLSHS